MEMVLESKLVLSTDLPKLCFNPSSNGNGAGISICSVFGVPSFCFNPSSNGNGAGINLPKHPFFCQTVFQSFF